MSARHPAIVESAARETTTLTALLVWTYRRQKADVMSGKDLWSRDQRMTTIEPEPAQQWSGCGCAQLEAVALLGVRIESGGWQRPAIHPDADLVHDCVVEMSKTNWIGAMLLMRHGRQGGEPEWSEGAQEFEPERDARDRIVQDRYDDVAPGASGFVDQGVVYASGPNTGTPLVQTSNTPQVGQDSVSGNVYSFNAGDAGLALTVTYVTSACTGGGTCARVFNNLARFGGTPFVPAPEMAY